MGDNFQVDYDEQLVGGRGVNGCKSNNVAEMREKAKTRDHYAKVLFLFLCLPPPETLRHQSLCKEQGTHTPGPEMGRGVERERSGMGGMLSALGCLQVSEWLASGGPQGAPA
jgi:hypothetical protein